MDRVTKEVRSRIMASIRAKDTAPEIAVRSLLWSEGYRYRLHYKPAPGRPDIAFPKQKKAIFVHGCFWHFHGCNLSRMPKTATPFWSAKFERNRVRDARKIKELNDMGWRTLVV